MARTVSGPVVTLFLVALLGGDGPAPNAGRLDVSSLWSATEGRIVSLAPSEDGSMVLHGLQIVTGSKKELREMAMFNQGRLESRTQYHANGNTFRERRREHDGNGYEIAYEPERTKVLAASVIVDGGADIGPIKEQERICWGKVRGDKCWSGRFLRWRHVPGTYQEQLELHTYRDGQLVGTTPYDLAKLALPPDPAKDEGSSAWPWNWRHYEAGEWPVVLREVRAPRK